MGGAEIGAELFRPVLALALPSDPRPPPPFRPSPPLSSLQPIRALLVMAQMNSPDKDIRYMATNDLISELKKESFGIDETLERKVVHQVLKLLEDKNGEVQNLVVKGYVDLGPAPRAQRPVRTEQGLGLVALAGSRR